VDAQLSQQVRQSFLDSDRTYGARRGGDVLGTGHTCGLHRIERLRRMQAFRARPRRRRVPVDSGVRSIAAVAANQRTRSVVRDECAQPQMGG